MSIFTMLLCSVLLNPINELPKIVDIGMACPDLVAVTIHEGKVDLGSLVGYQPQPGDELKHDGKLKTTLTRGGVNLGTIAGQGDQRMLRLPDKFSGLRIDRKKLIEPQRWKVSDKPVQSVSYKTHVLDAAEDQWGGWKVAFAFTVFLKLEESLPQGKHLISFDELEPFVFHWDDQKTISPAVHVSAMGYRPSDPVKPATLSCWTGDGFAIDYLRRFPKLRYHLVDHESGKELLGGSVRLAQKASTADDYQPIASIGNKEVNRFGGPVFQLPIHEIERPGTYRVTVDGIGSSKPFRIADNAYTSLWQLALRGLHAHRRNFTLKITSVDGEVWTRPAADDSSAVYSTARMGNANFDAFVAGATEQPAPETRGGWMDAGDFDSNFNHYWVSLMLLDLIDRHPEHLSSDRTGITDSGNGIPDLLDEGLWMIDCYRAMQMENGSVTSGIEYAEHPRAGEPSHLNTLPVYQLASSPRSNFLFAAAASRAARIIAAGNYRTQASADDYLDSAEKAFSWAELNRLDPNPDNQEDTEAARLLASCELLLAGNSDLGQAWLDQVDALVENPWVLPLAEVNEGIVAFLRLGSADLTEPRKAALSCTLYQKISMSYLDGSTRRSGFGVLKNGWAPFGFGVGGCPMPGTHHTLLFPQVVPDDRHLPPHIKPDRTEFLSAGISGLAFVLGHHPTNRPYVTGLESLNEVDNQWQSIHNILHLDSRYAGHRAPVGITVYGAVNPVRDGDSWPINWPLSDRQAIHPDYESWPAYENLHQFPMWGAMMEYTIWQSIGPTIWFAAELDARGR
ncbi:MAG: glycoside hydrolase family 9 protein [Planctomycetota bacterium]